MPKYTTTSGISAIGGSARKKLIKGSKKVRAPLYQPIRKPTGTASAIPSATPSVTRWVDLRMSMPKRPPNSSSTSLDPT